MKRCYTCEKRKPIGDFYRDKRLKDGRRYQCKACTKTRVITPAQKQRHDAQKRAWRATNKTRTAAYGRVWYAKNKARLQAEYSANRAEHLVASARSRARIKRVPFRLTAADILPAIAAGVCEMTGVPFDFTGRRSARIPSLDRIHPKKGYIPGNVRVICWQMNVAIGAFGEDSLLELTTAWAERKRKK